MASNDMDDFLSALGEEDLIGLSSYNPTDQKNNCVFVTLAHLMGYKSTAELDVEVRKDMASLPKDGSGGVPLASISALIKKTGKQFVYKSFRSSSTGAGTQTAALPGAKPLPKGTNVAGIRGEEMLLGEWNVTQIGIIYIRPAARGGHCIVLKQTLADGLKYICYQSESGGKDLWADAAGKKVAGGLPTVADPTKGTKVLAAFAIVDHADIPSRIDPPNYELGNPPPSGASMLSNTAATVAAPAASALAKAFVQHLAKPVTATPTTISPTRPLPARRPLPTTSVPTTPLPTTSLLTRRPLPATLPPTIPLPATPLPARALPARRPLPTAPVPATPLPARRPLPTTPLPATPSRAAVKPVTNSP